MSGEVSERVRKVAGGSRVLTCEHKSSAAANVPMNRFHY